MPKQPWLNRIESDASMVAGLILAIFQQVLMWLLM